ncbi:NADH-ubiquinone oxidoreductase chain 5 [Frankliniella fusca]|uniref:NADH-ubiquinone oxidoreductase chain 5 n=1 Tax=Frankliniella fusca TaxID=407009 RepID=A0AAE1GVC3_9NEOP|nr:NADH-ubiquinone oxidoreductase chain 5 [Frankliniella fusca]
MHSSTSASASRVTAATFPVELVHDPVSETTRNAVTSSMSPPELFPGMMYGVKDEFSKDSLSDVLCKLISSVILQRGTLSCNHSTNKSCSACIEGIAQECSQLISSCMSYGSPSFVLPPRIPSALSEAPSQCQAASYDITITDHDLKPDSPTSKFVDSCRLGKRKAHCPTFSKNVPPEYALRMRGCECPLCGDLFKGIECSAVLIKHVKERHRKFATAKYLRKVSEAVTADRIIGEGMWYCLCQRCRSH